MIEFGSGHFGWPWHGLYKRSDNQIISPAGVAVDYPAGADNPTGGDAYAIKIPGLPQPATTQAEADAGMSWQPWAIVSGGDHCIYGVALTGKCHIYIDSAGRPWLVKVELGGTRVGQVLNAYVSIKRFGVVGVAVDPWQTIDPISVSFDLHPQYSTPAGWTAVEWHATFDIAENGGRLLVGIWRGQTQNLVTKARGVAMVAEITLHGSPAGGDFSASIALVTDESETDEYIDPLEATASYVWLARYVEPIYTAPPEPTPENPSQFNDIGGETWYYDGQWAREWAFSFHTLSAEPALSWPPPGYTHSRRVTVSWDYQTSQRWGYGARYSASGAVEVITATDVASRSETNAGQMIPSSGSFRIMDYDDQAWSCEEDGEATQILRSIMQVGGVEVVNQTTRHMTRHAVGPQPTVIYSPLDRSFTSTTTTSDGGSSTSAWTEAANDPADYRYIGFVAGADVGGTNSAKVLVQKKYNHASADASDPWFDTAYQYGPVVGTVQTIHAYYDQLRVSEHPITHEVAISTDQEICWV